MHADQQLSCTKMCFSECIMVCLSNKHTQKKLSPSPHFCKKQHFSKFIAWMKLWHS